MADLISREALMRKMLDPIYTWEDYDEMENLVSYLPAVDAVPVVRCKDCKWYEPLCDFGFNEETGRRDHSKIVEKPYGECHGQDFVFTEDGYLRVGQDDFCSYGERREENGK